jgi:hypothetical protein
MMQQRKTVVLRRDGNLAAKISFIGNGNALKLKLKIMLNLEMQIIKILNV